MSASSTVSDNKAEHSRVVSLSQKRRVRNLYTTIKRVPAPSGAWSLRSAPDGAVLCRVQVETHSPLRTRRSEVHFSYALIPTAQTWLSALTLFRQQSTGPSLTIGVDGA